MSTRYQLIRAHRIGDYQVSATKTVKNAVQISRGPFFGVSELLIHPDVTISRRYTAQTIYETGAIPDGFAAFSLHMNDCPFYAHGLVYQSGDISAMRGFDNFQMITTKGCRYVTIKVNENTLPDYVDANSPAKYFDLFQNGVRVSLARNQLFSDLCALINTVLDRFATSGLSIDEESLLRPIRKELLDNLIRLVDDAKPITLRANDHLLLFNKALRVIHEANLDTLTVDNVCETIGASRRNLELVFQRCIDVSPKEYINSLRLNQIYQILSVGDPHNTTVVETAARFGFVHMGNFANTYRTLFHELPSTTLKQNKQRVGETTA